MLNREGSGSPRGGGLRKDVFRGRVQRLHPLGLEVLGERGCWLQAGGALDVRSCEAVAPVQTGRRWKSGTRRHRSSLTGWRGGMMEQLSETRGPGGWAQTHARGPWSSRYVSVPLAFAQK